MGVGGKSTLQAAGVQDPRSGRQGWKGQGRAQLAPGSAVTLLWPAHFWVRLVRKQRHLVAPVGDCWAGATWALGACG